MKFLDSGQTKCHSFVPGPCIDLARACVHACSTAKRTGNVCAVNGGQQHRRRLIYANVENGNNSSANVHVVRVSLLTGKPREKKT